MRYAPEAQLKVYAGMIFANVLAQPTKRYIMQQADGIQKRADIEKIRTAVGELIKLEAGWEHGRQQRPGAGGRAALA